MEDKFPIITWLKKQYDNMLETLLDDGKLDLYRQIKTSCGAVSCLFNISNFKLWQSLTKFRISAHRFPIESGRYNNTYRHNGICYNVIRTWELKSTILCHVLIFILYYKVSITIFVFFQINAYFCI